KAIHVSNGGLVRSEKFGTGYAWTPAKESRKGLIVRPGTAIELPDVGDFEKDRAFTVTFWARNNRPGQTGAILARMDIGDAFRGWDAWMENGRMAMHIIHHWPDDALKVSCQSPLPVNQWAHVTISYDGSGKAGGVHIFVDGEPQQLSVDVDTLANTIR